MKFIIALVCCLNALVATAQWTNTTNLFYDSLHQSVCSANKTQYSPIVVQSYPDSGYFVIWEDNRNDPANSKSAIYAQKYDKTGIAQWTADGVPVSSGTHSQYYNYVTTIDYRSFSFACTDSAGGFYITYADDSINLERVCVQHMQSTGSPVFGGPGIILATSTTGDFHMTPRLIADGNKGFFVSFRSSTAHVYVQCYKDISGNLKYYGGGAMNDNAFESIASSSCGNYSYVTYPDAIVIDYSIFSDLQGGCNIVMHLIGNGVQGQMLAYNKLFRPKNAAVSTQYVRGLDNNPTPVVNAYQVDSVYRLYYLMVDHQEIHCGTNPVITVNQFRLVQQGYQVIDGYSPATIYDFNYAKGVTVSTTGNINATLIGSSKRIFNPGVSHFTIQGYGLKEEVYDSIPYQRASFSDPDYPGYNYVEPSLSNKLNYFRDTLLGEGTRYYDFSFSGGGSQVFAAAIITDPTYPDFSQAVRLQHLAVERQSSDSFAIVFKTSRKAGDLIGKDQGDYRYTTQYDLPFVTVNTNGIGLFSIWDKEMDAPRISPVFTGASLAWGGMGRTTGTSYLPPPVNYFNEMLPKVALDPVNGKGLIAWVDNRNSTTGLDIYMRHIDSLHIPGYYPPVRRLRILQNPYTACSSTKTALFGISKSYALFESYSPYSDIGCTPVAEIKDDNYLGAIVVRTFQNVSSIRKFNGKAYLDRNFTIYCDSLPPGKQNKLRLYFTKAEFNALKAADNSVNTPADLVVIHQPNNSSAYPTSYSPVAGEETLNQVRWDSVSNGYYIEVVTNKFGDYFIQKASVTYLCPGGNGSIVSNITGATYQWQVNTGSGFTNLTNNANYNNVNTFTLQLTSIPSSFTGYQYRCVVNGVTTNSNITTLRFQNSWTGAVDNAWENAANWSCSSVPDLNTDVILNSGTVTVNSVVLVRSLIISPGVSFTVNPGFSFTVLH